MSVCAHTFTRAEGVNMAAAGKVGDLKAPGRLNRWICKAGHTDKVGCTCVCVCVCVCADIGCMPSSISYCLPYSY